MTNKFKLKFISFHYEISILNKKLYNWDSFNFSNIP